jgi:NitT/TauT family transport system permease protein
MTAVMQGDPRDGTDAAALPLAVVERRWLFLTIATWHKIVAPVATGLAVLGLWEFIVWKLEVPYYILPGPGRSSAP